MRKITYLYTPDFLLGVSSFEFVFAEEKDISSLFVFLVSLVLFGY